MIVKYTKVCSNEKFDFYVSNKLGYYYYIYAVLFGEHPEDTATRRYMAGQSTKKSAINTAHTCAGWMK